MSLRPGRSDAAGDTREDDPRTIAQQAPGFWRASLSLMLPSLRELLRYELYAALAGLIVCLLFLQKVLWSRSVSFLPRLFFFCASPFYFPLLFSANAAVMAILSAVSRNITRLEGAIRRVAEAIVGRVLPELPAAAVSFDELRSRLASSGQEVRDEEGRVDKSRGPVAVVSRALLGAAIKAVLVAFEYRYSRELRAADGDSAVLSANTVKSILTSELAGLVLSPFTGSVQLYMILVATEFTCLCMLPFLLLLLWPLRAETAGAL